MMKINKRYKITVIFFLAINFVFIPFLLASDKETPQINILLITLDALRADHLRCYGYQRETSPNIDRLAKEGFCFLNCYAISGSTIHAFPPLFSGQYLGVFSFDVLNKEYANILDKKFTTLAEYLENLNYYTAAFINSGYLRTKTGFEQGFKIYNNLIGDAKATTEEVISFLNNYSQKQPFFIWVHYTDTHAPYIFLEKDFKIFENDKLFKKNDKILKLNPMNNSNFYVSKGYLPKKVFRKNKYSLNYYIACYDAAISYVDFNIGRLLENVKENTLIILTADHGESLGEHEVYFNHEKLYDEILHIPLIIRDNEYFKRGKRISKAVSAIDIVPTILSRIDPDTYFLNKNKFDGLDLKKISEDKYTERKYIYFYFPKVWGVRDVDKKIKYFLHKNKREELYLLPDEYNNLINNVSPVISSFRKKLRYNLEAWLKIYPIRCDINIKKMPLDEDAKNNLRSLGYLQ